MEILKDIKTEQLFYVAEDDTVFFDEKECKDYEKNNAYIKYIKNIPRIENIPFLNNHLINGFWCTEQKTIDAFSHWWDQKQKLLGNQSFTSGTFNKNDYYFIIMNLNKSNFSKKTFIYDIISFEELTNRWNYLCSLVPPPILNQEIDTETNKFSNNFSDILNEIKELDNALNDIKIT